jgi:hypothetical protein
MKAALVYILLVLAPVAVVLKVLQAGEHLSGMAVSAQAASGPAPSSLPQIALLMAQIAVIIGFSRLLGSWFGKLRQPQVIGEMIAGVMLGPSLLGWIFPRVSAVLFPDSSIGLLNGLSQVGLIFFMFLVGLQLDPKELRDSRRTAIVTSHASIVFPFTLGAVLALYLYPRLGSHDTAFSHFALFVGTAMSITAFPVLARILTDANALRTRVGAIAIACAAVDDVTAWCILAALLLLVRSGSATFPLWAMLSGSAAYSALMLFGARRWLLRLESISPPRLQFAKDAGWHSGPGLGFSRDDRAPRNSRLVRSFCSGSCDAQGHGICKGHHKQDGRLHSCFAASAFLCIHRSSDKHRSFVGSKHVGLLRAHHSDSDTGKVRGLDFFGSADRVIVAGRLSHWDTDEHQGTDGIGGPEHRVGCWRDHPHSLHDDGDHGFGHDGNGRAAFGVVSSELGGRAQGWGRSGNRRRIRTNQMMWVVLMRFASLRLAPVRFALHRFAPRAASANATSLPRPFT